MKCEKCKKAAALRGKNVCGICEVLEAQQPPGGTCTGWPMKSLSMAVHSEQAQEANQFLAANGISSREAYHEKDGTLVLESAKARKKVIAAKNKAMGTDKYKDLSAFN